MSLGVEKQWEKDLELTSTATMSNGKTITKTIGPGKEYETLSLWKAYLDKILDEYVFIFVLEGAEAIHVKFHTQHGEDHVLSISSNDFYENAPNDSINRLVPPIYQSQGKPNKRVPVEKAREIWNTLTSCGFKPNEDEKLKRMQKNLKKYSQIYNDSDIQ